MAVAAGELACEPRTRLVIAEHEAALLRGESRARSPARAARVDEHEHEQQRPQAEALVAPERAVHDARRPR